MAQKRTATPEEIAEQRIREAAEGKSSFLDLSELSLSFLPESVANLDHLEILRLNGNQLRALPELMQKLRQLCVLHLHGNQLENLPEFLGSLPQLAQVVAMDNQLTKLPASIGDWPALEYLYLAENQLAGLPASMRKMPNLKALFLHGNDALGIPVEILGARFYESGTPVRPADILDYYFDTQRGAKPLNEVKLLLVGRGGAGKSSIRDRLLHDQFNSDKHETPGIQIDQWPLDVNEETVRVHVWDFAGQEITHATHRFFLTERSVYLLVLNARSDTQDFDADYWLRLIAAFGKDSPVIVALNMWEDKPFDVDRLALQDKYPAIYAFVPTDCATKFGMAELQQKVQDAIESIEAVHEPFPAVWADLKQYFSKMDERPNYQSLPDFRKQCVKFGEKDRHRQERLARTLHALGTILHYADDPRLRDTTVLNPHWVTESIYILLRLKEGLDSGGMLTLDEACAALPKEPRQMVRYLIELMRRFELCFPADEPGEQWLVPELLPRFQPKLEPTWTDAGTIRLRYEYCVLPEGIIPRLITRTYPLSEGQIRWRYGVVLEMEGANALVRANIVGAPQVNVSIQGEPSGRLRLAKLIRGQFRHMHADIHGLNPHEMVEVEEHPGFYKNVQTLEMDERSGKTTTIDTESGSEELNQKRELDRISSPKARDPKRRRLKLFLSYSHHDAELRDKFMLNLDLLQADGLVDSWFDGKILPSAEWDKEIRRELDETDVIVFLVSTTFLSSKYIRGVEMKRALERREAGAAELVSVILESCKWQGRPFTKYQVIQPGGKTVRQHNRHRDAFNDVETRLRQLIAEVEARLS